MSRRGPAPKPTSLKILEGNPGKRPLNHDEPQPEVGIPTCPSFLDTEAKKEWNRVVPELVRTGVLAKIDRSIVAVYCQAWADFHNACRALADSADGTFGFVLVNNQWHPHPATKTKRDAEVTLLKYAAELGIGAACRCRIKVSAPQPQKKKVAEFAASRGA